LTPTSHPSGWFLVLSFYFFYDKIHLMKIDKLKTGILFLFLSFFIPTITFGYTLGENGNFYTEESFAENGAIQLGGELIFS